MEICLIVIGKTSTKYISEGISEYEKRLRRYVPFTIHYLPDCRRNANMTQQRQKDIEGQYILQKLSTSDRVVLLDEKGVQQTSEAFATLLDRRMASGLKRLVFIVGGPYGFSKEVYERADALFSLSKMTFNHEMVRLFFIEQVYRAMTILRGEPYHHQ